MFKKGDYVVRQNTSIHNIKRGHVYTVEECTGKKGGTYTELAVRLKESTDPMYTYDGDNFRPLGKHKFLPGDIVVRMRSGDSFLRKGEKYIVDRLSDLDEEGFHIAKGAPSAVYLDQYFKRPSECKEEEELVMPEVSYAKKYYDDTLEQIRVVTNERETAEALLLQSDAQLEVLESVLKVLEEVVENE